MNTKRIPAIVMLLGGAVACIVAYINNYNLKDMLMVVTLALVLFLGLGVVIKLIFDSFKFPDEEKVDDEGEVVEKQGENSENVDELEGMEQDDQTEASDFQ